MNSVSREVGCNFLDNCGIVYVGGMMQYNKFMACLFEGLDVELENTCKGLDVQFEEYLHGT